MLHMIVAPCGAGKTTLAINKLAGMWGDKSNALYLIDSVAGRDQLLQNEKFRCYDRNWRAYLEQNQEDQDDRLTVMTYACFGTLCRHIPDWYCNLHTLICDEIQSLSEMSGWERGRKCPDEEQIYGLAYGVIVNCAITGTIKSVIALTATPEPIYKDLECDPKT